MIYYTYKNAKDMFNDTDGYVVVKLTQENTVSSFINYTMLLGTMYSRIMKKIHIIIIPFLEVHLFIQ